MTWSNFQNDCRKDGRKQWLRVHRWLGYIAGFHLVLLGLSGSLLVFFKEADRLLAPSRYSHQPSGGELGSLNQMAETLLSDFGSRTQLIYVLPGNLSSTLEFWIATQAGGSSRVACNFDRTTGSLLQCWTWSKTVMSWIYDFHHEIFLGEVGAKCVGFAGLLSILLLITGFFLWWPRSTYQWKNAFRFVTGRTFFRTNFDVHRLFGLYSSLALLFISFSGVALTFHDTLKTVVNLVSQTSEHPEFKLAHTVPGNLYDEVWFIAKRAYPGSELVYITPPASDRGAYEIGIVPPRSSQIRGVLTELWVDPVEGKILEERAFERRTLGDRFVMLQFPIHNGDVFGLIGRLFVLLMGGVPLVLFVTGVIMALKRRR
jgi:uncharacterized iron-regulated membrane protein